MEFLVQFWSAFGGEIAKHSNTLVTAIIIAPLFLWLRKIGAGVISWVVAKMKAFVHQFLAMPSLVAAISTNLTALTEKVDQLEKQVGSNGGSSLHDNVYRIKIGISSLIQKERALVNASHVMMWHSNELGLCEWASNDLQALVGYSFEEGFMGLNWSSLCFPEDRHDIEKRWEQFVESGTSLTLRTRYRHITGEAIPVLIEAKKLPDMSIVGIVRDLRNTKILGTMDGKFHTVESVLPAIAVIEPVLTHEK